MNWLFAGFEKGQWARRAIAIVRSILKTAAAACMTAMLVGMLPMTALGAALSGDARTAIPYGVQQLIVVDYRSLQNSSVAMQLKDRVLPPELKSLEDALKKSGLNENHDVDVLAFASFRDKPGAQASRIVGVAQGQFPMRDVLLKFKKNGIKPTVLRTNKIYPMGNSGMRMCFLNSSTFIFGGQVALQAALDARDGLTPSMLTNSDLLDLMPSVQNDAVWSVLDSKGTQTMMQSVLGQGGGQLADFETVKKRLTASRYSLDFQNGVSFNLDVITPDNFSAATMSALMNAALLYRKMSASDLEKQALSETTVKSSAGTLEVRYEASDNEFAGLLQSNLFQAVVH
jgi:hypothetical protein